MKATILRSAISALFAVPALAYADERLAME